MCMSINKQLRERQLSTPSGPSTADVSLALAETILLCGRDRLTIEARMSAEHSANISARVRFRARRGSKVRGTRENGGFPSPRAWVGFVRVLALIS